jgi:hypothetical protein
VPATPREETTVLFETSNPRTKLCLLHHDAEDSLDVDATLATIEGEPIYELLPIGLRMVGREMARRFYTQYLPRRRDAVAVDGVAGGFHECDVGLFLDGVACFPTGDGRFSEPQAIACLLIGGETGVVGERLWADERYYRYLFGDVFADLEPIPWRRRP